MIEILHNINVDWLGKRKPLLMISIALMLAGLVSAVAREAMPGGTRAFNLGVDFLEGSQVTAEFNARPDVDRIRQALSAKGIGDASVQPVIDFDRQNQVVIRVSQDTARNAIVATGQPGEDVETQISNAGRQRVEEALNTLGDLQPKIISTEYVGPAAAPELRNRAIQATLIAMVGILLYIAFRFEWTYGAAAVITVFHDVLVTLGLFSVFQIEINLTVVAAFLTLVGFSVNDTIVTFDRVRENLRLDRKASLYKITNDAINQTMSRTIITGGLVLLSVFALVIFGGEVLRPFSICLFIGIIIGTYSTIVVSNPLMVWWQMRNEALDQPATDTRRVGQGASRTTAAKRTRTSQTVAR